MSGDLDLLEQGTFFYSNGKIEGIDLDDLVGTVSLSNIVSLQPLIVYTPLLYFLQN